MMVITIQQPKLLVVQNQLLSLILFLRREQKQQQQQPANQKRKQHQLQLKKIMNVLKKSKIPSKNIVQLVVMLSITN